MTKEEFIKAVAKLDINLTDAMLEKLDIYEKTLLEENVKVNLTAIKTTEEVYLKHFYDSLTITKLAKLEEGSILDIGSGAGFPGLVLAITHPNLQVTLLDSNNKKITFLNQVINKLNLDNVVTVYSRAEEYTKINREKYDYVTSRAVASLRILVELGIPALKIHGHYLIMKGNVTPELTEAKPTIVKLGSKIINEINFSLPHEAGERTLLDIQKQHATNLMYPRTYDKIKKHPLK